MAATVLQRFEQDAALLDTLFTEAPVGLAFFDRDLRYVRVNTALAEINGVDAEDHVGRTVSEVLPDMDPEVVVGLRRVLETGEPIKDVEVVGQTPSQPGRERTWLCGWYPVRSREGGAILGIGAIVLEVTARVRAERRSAFLARIGEALAETLDFEETLLRVAQVAIPSKADLCVVHLQDEAGRVQRLLGVHRDADLQAVTDELHERWSTKRWADQEISRVLRTGTPSFVRQATPDDVLGAAEHDDQVPLLHRLDLTSWIVVPMTARGRTLGTLTFAMSGSGRVFDDDDFELALDIARRAAAAVDTARLYRERDHIAQTLQRSLLPPRLPDIPGFEIAGLYRPAGEAYDVGGDFYDVVGVPDGWSLVVGDVCGKGPEAAALTALARYTLRAAYLVDSQPARVLSLLNDALLRDREDDRFLTACAARLSGSRLELAVAGQSPALVIRADGTVESLGRPGRVVGIRSDLALEEHATDLGIGDAVLFYTDGLSDAGAPGYLLEAEEIGTFAARTLEHGASAVASSLESRALSVSNGHPRDDIALMVLRRTG
jgi:PAS domain S-box-containing protein